MKMAPSHFDGQFADFFRQFVLPNLPSLERVAEFDLRLRRHLDSANPFYPVRTVAGLKRGEIIHLKQGGRILPTDNSPVWWLHSFLLSSKPFPKDDASFFGNLPAHMFSLRIKRKYLNSAGYHAAHLANAKNGDVEWEKWSEKELRRRTFLNIHPCNVTLIAKSNWQTWGGNDNIITWTKNEYSKIYGDVFLNLLKEIGASRERGDTSVSIHYHYDESKKGKKERVNSAASYLGLVREINRPLIDRRLLKTGTILKIATEKRTFIVPHDDLFAWVASQTNALSSNSWRDKGLYSWPRASKSMIVFLSSYEE